MILGGAPSDVVVSREETLARATEAYVRVWRLFGALPWVSRNRRARKAFLASLRWLEGVLGTPSSGRPVTTRSGIRLECDLRDRLQAEVFYLRSYSEREIELLKQLLSPGQVFLDVGAHFGLFTIEIARHLGPRGTVYSFEPSPDVVERLRHNAFVNGVADRIRTFELALDREEGTLELHADPDHPFDISKRSLFGTGPVIARVLARPLDDLVKRGEVSFDAGLDAVKIDVEGAEARVLRGMQETLGRYRPRVVVLEVMKDHLERAGSSIEEVRQVMGSLGYVPLTRPLDDHPYVVNVAFTPG